jgi:Predicted integral membrane protein (DUF2269)
MKVGDIELFFHLCGVICIFLGFGTLLLATLVLARASRVEQVRAIMTPMVAGRRIGPEQISLIDVIVVVGVLLIVATGIAMARANNYVWSSWVEVATASFILLAPVGPFVINPRLHAIAEEAEREADGPLPASLRDRIHDQVLALAMRSSVAVLVGLVFLMTTKPTLVASVVVILAAVVIGGASSPSISCRRESR